MTFQPSLLQSDHYFLIQIRIHQQIRSQLKCMRKIELNTIGEQKKQLKLLGITDIYNIKLFIKHIQNEVKIDAVSIYEENLNYYYDQLNNLIIGNSFKIQLLNFEMLIDQVPKQFLTKDKKINSALQKVAYLSKKRSYSNKLLSLMHKAEPGYLEPEESQQTLRIKQQQLAKLVNTQTASYQFQLDLNFGKYHAQYNINGSRLLLGSSMGHLSIMDWRNKDLTLQIHLREEIKDAKFLHSQQLFALAQNKHLFIYDNQGTQIHKLPYSQGIEYLPYHFLLASYTYKKLTYYDTSSGQIVAAHPTKKPYTMIRQNPRNAVIALGTANGTVQWWTPGTGTPVVQLFTGASVTDVGFYRQYMITASQNIKIWDTRMLKVMNEFSAGKKVKSLEVSKTGILSINYGYKLQLFKDYFDNKPSHPYMKHISNKHIHNAKFVPFEDILGLGLQKGFSSIIIPGSGDPNYDTFQINPFQSKKQRRQNLVHRLLEKLPPQTIVVNPNLIGTVDPASKQVIQKQKHEEEQKKIQQQKAKLKKKNKTRGRNSVAKRHDKKTKAKQQEKRKLLSNQINLKLLAKRAQRQKKKSQLEILEDLNESGFDPMKIITKTKKIKKQLNE